jgi:hypothetical protein
VHTVYPVLQKYIEIKESYQAFEGELKNLRDELEKRQAELKQELEKETIAEPVVSEVGDEDELINLREELKKRQEGLKQELEKERRVEPAVIETSGKETGTRRRRRHGAKLPIPTKSLEVSRDQRNQGTSSGVKVSIK